MSLVKSLLNLVKILEFSHDEENKNLEFLLSVEKDLNIKYVDKVIQYLENQILKGNAVLDEKLKLAIRDSYKRGNNVSAGTSHHRPVFTPCPYPWSALSAQVDTRRIVLFEHSPLFGDALLISCRL